MAIFLNHRPIRPMISVENLSKTYSGFRAVQGISFHVNKGEIVGFLGPNGAGKSTTMKVLAATCPDRRQDQHRGTTW